MLGEERLLVVEGHELVLAGGFGFGRGGGRKIEEVEPALGPDGHHKVLSKGEITHTKSEHYHLISDTLPTFTQLTLPLLHTSPMATQVSCLGKDTVDEEERDRKKVTSVF